MTVTVAFILSLSMLRLNLDDSETVCERMYGYFRCELNNTFPTREIKKRITKY